MEQLGDLTSYVLAMRPADVIDILLVAGLVYALLYVVRGTRAVELLRGILLLILIVFLFGQVAQLRAFSWLAGVLLPVFLIALPVIFQPELRRALERIGRAGLILGRAPGDASADAVVAVVSIAARQLSELRCGALIVLERETGLQDLVERGVRLDALASVDLLLQLFVPNTPLHDGAVFIRDGRIVAAGVVLPLGEIRAGDRGLGTRHLAALAVTEATDALAVVISEETGTISLARAGELYRNLDEGELSRLMVHLMAAGRPGPATWLRRPLRRGHVASAPPPPPLEAPLPDEAAPTAVLRTEDLDAGAEQVLVGAHEEPS